MKIPNENENGNELTSQFSIPNSPFENESAWEEIETGRFMPRRIRGSFKGRALG